jgi:lysophospholipase L1-like esterase
MDIREVDKNFAFTNAVKKGRHKVYTMPTAPFDLYGVYYNQEDGRFERMPYAVAEKANPSVKILYKHTAGGRIRFATDSSFIGITAKWNERWLMGHMPLTGSAGFVLMAETKKGKKLVCGFRPESWEEKGFTKSVKRPRKMTYYELYLPLYNELLSLEIELTESAKVEHGLPYKDVAPIVYYGSSITQGGCASRSDNSYQSLIEKWNNVDYINYGLSGAGKGDPSVVDYITDIDCSVFVCDYDHNSDTPELKERHYKFYETFRKKHPTTPFIMISRPDYYTPITKDALKWGREGLKIIKESYKKAIETGDKNVYFIDGRTFFNKRDREWCTVDGIHPNDLGFYKMAKGIYKKLVEIDEIFK